MYYGHMSKDEIMNSSMPFLIGIYKQYAKRACENLGVPLDGQEEEEVPTNQLRESDYPTEFRKLSQKERNKAISEYESTEDFMRQFKNL